MLVLVLRDGPAGGGVDAIHHANISDLRDAQATLDTFLDARDMESSEDE